MNSLRRLIFPVFTEDNATLFTPQEKADLLENPFLSREDKSVETVLSELVETYGTLGSVARELEDLQARAMMVIRTEHDLAKTETNARIVMQNYQTLRAAIDFQLKGDGPAVSIIPS